jgi:hypothetical protein
MGVIYTEETEYAKERRKFEGQNSMFGPSGRPYAYREYPTCMYFAGIPEGEVGAPRIIAMQPDCDEDTANNLASRGWRKKPTEAIEAYHAQKLEEAKLAAEIEHEIHHKLTEKAVAEVRAHQGDHEGHMPTVPETPIVRRVQAASDGVARQRQTTTKVVEG